MALIQSESKQRFAFSPQDLFGISQAISREFSPIIPGKSDELLESSIPFSARELLSISDEISREFAPRVADNRANLVILPIDGRRLHAYWQLPVNKTNSESPSVTENLTLRIFKRQNAQETGFPRVETSQSMDIIIDAAKNRQEIVLPADMLPANDLVAAIGRMDETRDFTVIVDSNLANMPNQQYSVAGSDKSLLSPTILGIIMSGLNDSSSTVKTQP